MAEKSSPEYNRADSNVRAHGQDDGFGGFNSKDEKESRRERQQQAEAKAAREAAKDKK